MVSKYFLFFYKFTQIKTKSFECTKSIRNYEKIMLGISDACLISNTQRIVVIEDTILLGYG